MIGRKFEYRFNFDVTDLDKGEIVKKECLFHESGDPTDFGLEVLCQIEEMISVESVHKGYIEGALNFDLTHADSNENDILYHVNVYWTSKTFAIAKLHDNELVPDEEQANLRQAFWRLFVEKMGQAHGNIGEQREVEQYAQLWKRISGDTIEMPWHKR